MLPNPAVTGLVSVLTLLLRSMFPAEPTSYPLSIREKNNPQQIRWLKFIYSGYINQKKCIVLIILFIFVNNTITFIVNYKYKEIQIEVGCDALGQIQASTQPLATLFDGIGSLPNALTTLLSENIRMSSTLKSSFCPFSKQAQLLTTVQHSMHHSQRFAYVLASGLLPSFMSA